MLTDRQKEKFVYIRMMKSQKGFISTSTGL